ncbi:MAG TPA: PAS domain S-box protein [candidate division Zixibacteria bacterium]|nr:PAS domain S-box protein [candidate division Zixibacteria bacterium]
MNHSVDQSTKGILKRIPSPVIDAIIVSVGFILAAFVLTATRSWSLETHSTETRLINFILPLLAALTVVVIRRLVFAIRRIHQQEYELNELSIYRLLTDSALMGFCVINFEGKFIYVNPRMADLHGYTAQDMIGRHFTIIHPEDQHPKLQQLWLRLMTGDQFGPLEFTNIRRDGSTFPSLTNISVMSSMENHPVLVAVSTSDMTVQKKQELNLRRQAAFFRNNPSPVLLIDSIGTITAQNLAASAIVGSNAIGQLLSDILPEIEMESLLKMSDGVSPSLTVFAAGRKFLFTAVANRATQSTCLYGNDITERSRVEKELETEKAHVDAQLRQVKSLNHVGQLLEDTSQSTDELLQTLVDSLPTFLGEKNRLAARILIEGLQYHGQGFRDLHRAISSTIVVNNQSRGILQLTEIPNNTQENNNRNLTDIQYVIDLMAKSIGRFLERTESIRMLERSKEESRLILDTARDAFVGIKSTGQVTAWNRQAEEIFGYEHHQAIGRFLADLIIPEELMVKHIAGIQKYVEVGKSGLGRRRFQSTARHRDGHAFPVELTVWSVGGGENLRIYSLIHDISDRVRSEMELIKGQILLNTTLEATSEGIVITDDEGHILRCNAKAIQLYGISPNLQMPDNRELLLDHIAKRFTDREFAATRIERFLLSEDIFEEEVNLIDGRVYEISSHPLRAEGFSGRLWTTRDVSERKESERRLRFQNDFMSQVIDALSDPFFVIDAKTSAIVLSNRAAEFSRKDKRRICGIQEDGLEQSCDSVDFLNISQETIKSGKPAVVTGSYLTSTGDTRVLEVHAHPILDETGKVHQVILHEQDATERVERQRDLLMLSAAVDQSAHMIFVFDSNGRIRYVNPAFCDQTGYNIREVLDRPISLFETSVDKGHRIMTLIDQILSGDRFSGKLQLRRKGGKTFWARLSISAVRTIGESNEVRLLAVGEDISNELSTQQQLMESDKMSAIGTLAAGVAHEFKNYLAGIMANASFAIDQKDADDAEEITSDALTQILQLSEGANEIAMSLLSYSRSRADDRYAVIVRDIVTQTVCLIEKEFRSHSIEIITRLDDMEPLILSPSKIQQLLLNLLINAAQAIGDEGVVTITLTQREDQMILRVADSGKGIPVSHLHRIFDPFFSTKGVWGEDSAIGTGIGLSICRNIAREHNGDLTVESVIGVGTTFTLNIPIVTETTIHDELDGSLAKGPTMLLLCSDQHIVRHYQAQGEITETQVKASASLSDLDDDLATSADFVACDSRSMDRPSVLKLHELCRKNHLICQMINCGRDNSDQDEVGDGVIRFDGLPDIEILARNKRSRPRLVRH